MAKKSLLPSKLFFTLSIIIIPVIAVVLSVAWNIYGTSTPPADYGKGTMFDKIAHRYDFINRALALNMDISWRRTMINEILSPFKTTTAPLQFLDLATGTADVAILLARELNERNIDGHVLGIDPSFNMISVGREKIEQRQLSPQVKLDIGDARDLKELPNDYFDATTMSFGIRNVPERHLVLCEIFRVLKPGGIMAIMEFSEPEGSGVMSYLAKLFIRYVVPVMGAALSGAPREYMHLQNSIKEFPSPREFVDMIEGVSCGETKAGFGMEKVEHMNFGSVQLYLAKPIK